MSFSTYKSNKVLSRFPIWSGNPTMYVQEITGRFNALGHSFAESFQNYPLFRAKNKYSLTNKTDIEELNELFNENIGRWGVLWIPSWQKDIVITSNIGAADVNIDIEDIEYSTFYPKKGSGGSGTGRYLFFYKSRTEWYAREVTATPTSTQITIDSALGKAYGVNDFQMISFLYLSRFDVDDINWKYYGYDIAEAVLYFQELPNEYPTAT